MMLADDLMLEPTLLIGLSEYALQRQTRIGYELTRQDLHWHSIGWSPIESMAQAEYPWGEALIGISTADQDWQVFELLMHTVCEMSKFNFNLTHCMTRNSRNGWPDSYQEL
jgi:hypothetical protein